MSKNVFRGASTVSGFTETLGAVGEKPVESRRSGSSRIRSGLQAMFDKAREEGFSAGRLEGYQDGHANGFARGKREFEEAHGEALAEFREALVSFVERAQGAVDEWYATTEETLSGLAVEIARRAVCRELEVSRECIEDITRQALGEVRHGTEVRVKVNPFDASILHSRKLQIMASVAGIRSLEIVPDTSIVSGCQIETDGGVIDARIESYLARLAKEAA